MPTTFDFGRASANTPDSTVYVSSSNGVTITAVVDDGSIEIGDQVILSGANFNASSVSSQSGVQSGDTLFYLGSLDLGDGTFGYVFSLSSTIQGTADDSNSFLLLTDTSDNLPSSGSTAFSNFVLSALRSGIETQQLGNAPACFMKGTLIDTHSGAKEVQDVQPGDLVATARGTFVPVRWVGRQTMHKIFSGLGRQIVRLRAGALGDNLPSSDLLVTADHGMVIDDLVINASALVNGDTIAFVPPDELEDRLTVYHVETERHEAIFANGAPAETFVDIVERGNFDNHNEYLELCGAERIVLEMSLPRISTARLVPQAIKDRLGGIASTENDQIAVG